MGKINLSRNLFLELEELNRIKKLNLDDGLKFLLKKQIGFGGIIPGIGNDLGNNFKFELGHAYNFFKFTEDGVAYDKNANRIFYNNLLNSEWNIDVSAGGTIEKWAYIEYVESHIEVGTISVDNVGNLTGIGTEFTKLLRGNSTLVPNKIKIYEKLPKSGDGSGYIYTEKGIYEVNSISSDTVGVLNGSDDYNTGVYVYSVVGAFSPGSYSDFREEEIYSYDSVNVLFSDVLPTTLTENQYLLCKLTLDTVAQSLVIDDLRSQSIFKTISDVNEDNFEKSLGYYDLGKVTEEVIPAYSYNFIIPKIGRLFKIELEQEQYCLDFTYENGEEVPNGVEIIIYCGVSAQTHITLGDKIIYSKNELLTTIEGKFSPFHLLKSDGKWRVIGSLND